MLSTSPFEPDFWGEVLLARVRHNGKSGGEELDEESRMRVYRE